MLNGNRLKRLRLDAGYTHEELAELLEVSVSQIWRYEAEKVDPSSQVISRMAQLFKVTTDYLLGLSDEPTPGVSNGLSEREKKIISALRHDEPMEAIKAIVEDDK